MLKTIKGKIESVGPSRGTKDETVYDYIRFLNNNGEVVLVKSVKTRSTVDSYIQPGENGVFFLYGNGPHLLLAAQLGDRFASDFEGFVEDRRIGKIVTTLAFFGPVALIALGALLEGDKSGLATVGVFAILPCWGFGLFAFLPAFLSSKVPSAEQFEAARAAALGGHAPSPSEKSPRPKRPDWFAGLERNLGKGSKQ